MERQKGSGPALKAYLLATVGLVLPLWTTGGGLELQEWVLIRTVDGTVIASNYTWGGNTPITLKADFSKFFDDQFCESPAAVAVVNSLSNWQRPSVPFSPCDNAVKNYALRYAAHYGCPEPPQKKVYPCGTYRDFYCRQWGCETLASGWAPGAGLDKHIILHRHPSKEHGSEWNENCSKDNCNPTTVTVTDPGDPEWVKGRTWGVRLYVSGTDPGTFFTVRRLPTKGRPLLRGRGGGGGLLPPRPPPLAVVPTPSGAPPLPPKEEQSEAPTQSSHPTSRAGVEGRPAPESLAKEELRPPLREVGISLDRPRPQGVYALELLEKIFPFFNSTQPNLTQSCWLCLSPRPPFHVGVGVNSAWGGDLAPTLVNLTEQQTKDQVNECFLEGSITLAEFHGKGTCYLLAHFTLQGSNFSDYCLTGETVPLSPGQIIKAPEGVWFVCTEGVFKCLVPTNRPELCVSAFIIPQVYLYGGDPDFLLRSTGQEPRRVKRVPLLVPIIATIGVVGSAAMGAGALVHGDLSLRKLSQDFSKDVSLLQDQVSYLEKQVDSLAEVALQNRRGLDLLFLQQGGLCAALGEDCCLYANHSGIIRENIRTLTKRLKERERGDESSNWYESLFKTSPWLTTLLSAIAGPLLILLLALTLGPIFLNRLLAFIKERIATVKLMVLSQPYTILPLEDEEFESRI